MPFSPKTIEEKPYNICLNCKHIGKACDGPNVIAMETERWCEWCKLRKNYLGWTNAMVAEKSGIALPTIERIMAGNVKDPLGSTIRAVTRALINGTWGQYPCAMAAQDESEQQLYIAKLEAENKILSEKLSSETEAKEKAERVARQRWEQMTEKDRLLKFRARFLVFFASLAVVAVVVAFFALGSDAVINIGI